MKTDWKGKRVLILGGARQGQALARWLMRHGARVTLNDYQPGEAMRAAQDALADLPVTWVLGGHPLELLAGADVVCLSGGVPLTNPIAAEALKRGIPLTNDTQIFMEIVPCPTIGITGSAGKTTTTTLVGRMASKAMDEIRKLALPAPQVQADGTGQAQVSKVDSSFILHPSAFVGGNIGDPLLNHVDDMQPDDIAVLEISSFQLEQMTISPHFAAVLNVTPNHLDRHGTMAAYPPPRRAFSSSRPTTILPFWAATIPAHGTCATRRVAHCTLSASANYQPVAGGLSSARV